MRKRENGYVQSVRTLSNKKQQQFVNARVGFILYVVFFHVLSTQQSK